MDNTSWKYSNIAGGKLAGIKGKQKKVKGKDWGNEDDKVYEKCPLGKKPKGRKKEN